MKTPTKKIKKYKTVKIKAWAVLGPKGEWSEQVSAVMSPALIRFYEKMDKRGTIRFVPCTITYQIPLK